MKFSNYNLLCGDASKVLATLPDACVDLIVTSPPYDNLRVYNGFAFDFESIAGQLARVLKPGGVLVWVVGDQVINGSESGTSFRQALHFKDVLGLNLHDTMIYEKDMFAYPDKKRYRQIFEYMFVLSKGVPKTINLIADRPNKYAGDTVRGGSRQSDGTLKQKSGASAGRVIADVGVRYNIWRYTVGKNKSGDYDDNHPAVYPEKLAADHILSWSNPGDLVLDPFIGSGTSGKMALLNGRRFLGIDISAEYIEMSRDRMIKAISKKFQTD